jgi:hypothetical protein
MELAGNIVDQLTTNKVTFVESEIKGTLADLKETIEFSYNMEEKFMRFVISSRNVHVLYSK